ncbi:fibronectin type III domain-containing protein [Nocardioides sp. HDW12B]|uniref:fibronectin type III domain-containing protein n=1 Tax=Nocardioides sp. HDW12B TaxID=2714939 RepID=UPI0014091FE9|nr:fibronectin type III domain-containing protein [Nocardioides sp. HDW12B]QIK67379.1 fibronectin type III domain-containing protein [Nocardioides sp. HDW12B]
MSFDAAKYKNSVLVPLAKDKARLDVLQQVIRDVQGAGGVSAAARLNASELFAVEPGMGATELSAHFKSLEMTYNKQKNLPSAGLLKKLLDLFGKDKVGDPGFWAGLASSRGQALKGQLAEFAHTVAEEHPLDVVTPEQLSEIAAGMGLADLPETDLAAALAEQGVEVRPDFEIPKVALPPAIRKVTEFPEFRTIVDVVLRPEQPTDIAVIEELTFGSPARRLEPADVAAAKQRLQQQEAQVEERARQAAQNALGALTDLKSAFDIHSLTLAAIADATEDLLRRGLPKVAVRAELVKRGVRSIDASRLVAKLSASTQAQSLADVADLLAEGDLGEARRLLDFLEPQAGDDATEWAQAKLKVDGVEARKSKLVAEYEVAVKKRDFGAAARALSDALQIDTQDDGLRAKRDVLPPPPPANLSLRIDGRALEVAWSADGGDLIRYSVVRTQSSVPANHTDGEVLASVLSQPRFRDDKAPIGVLVRYSVFATRDGSSYSDPATATSVVLPAPYDFAASPGTTDVSLSWATPPEAAGVVVTETAPDGTRKEHRPATPGQLAVGGLTTGTKYRFSAKAVYLLVGGERRESAAVELDATPRGSIRPVDDLRVEAALAGHKASWSSVVGYTVELWALPITAHVTPTTRITSAELTNLSGRRLTLRPGSGRSGETVREFDALPDVSLLVPITLDGDGGLVGTPQVAGSAPSVLKPTSERFGDELRLSWEWPKGDYMVEVGWQVGTRRSTRRVSRTSYNDDGGVRLSASEVAGEVTLATVVRAGSQEWVSAPISVPVSGVAPAVRYALSVKRSKFGGKGTVAVTVESPHFRGTAELLTVLKEAKFMPNAASDGTVVDRRVVDLSSGRSSFSLDLGKVVAPFWVRVFPEPSSGVRVEDPPTSQMRGQ